MKTISLLMIFVSVNALASINPCSKVSNEVCFNTSIELTKIGKTAEALDLLRYSCREKNFGKSCNEVGAAAYFTGNIKDAVKWYERACSLKYGIGCSNRGCFDDPSAVCKKVHKPDEVKALEFYLKGCEALSGASCYNYGLIMKKQKRFKRALVAFAVACSFKDEDGCAESGGKRASDVKDITESLKKIL